MMRRRRLRLGCGCHRGRGLRSRWLGVWRRVGASMGAFLCSCGEGGTAILAQTRPVTVSASLTRLSVPAERRLWPSGVKASERQEPLWRWVVHWVVIVFMLGGEDLCDGLGE